MPLNAWFKVKRQCKGNIPVKGERLGKALDIIASLRSCLSMAGDGGDIAKNPDQLLWRVHDHAKFRGQKSQKWIPQPIDDVIDIIREIKSAWDQIPEI